MGDAAFADTAANHNVRTSACVAHRLPWRVLHSRRSRRSLLDAVPRSLHAPPPQRLSHVRPCMFVAHGGTQYLSNNGPGPWFVANLTFQTLQPAYNGWPQTYWESGTGLWDVKPCPLTNNLDPTNPRTCDPNTCTSDPADPGLSFGCSLCDQVGRVGYIAPSLSQHIISSPLSLHWPSARIPHAPHAPCAHYPWHIGFVPYAIGVCTSD